METNLKLKPRLLEIAKLIQEGSKVIDVGADHGLLDIYLTKYKNCTCLAIDKSINCIKKTTENAIKYKANILIKQNDGLKGIKLKDEIIVISGVGTKTIKEILNTNIKNDLILVTHTDFEELKEYLKKINYKILNQKCIDNKYKIIYAKTT